ncbi:hypothetical protein [Paucibacter sp. M5-1]|uniref:hypothetical protein n=1 Tax=Paucibacter sp. M5-1 TaxID=3015998 RepID=UPI0022B8BCD1|nr:hypothetical protein [Paucibacter sp. M5-1]MCZ7884622.1 hypothetical protein [Paucibacter sp. M5-1]
MSLQAPFGLTQGMKLEEFDGLDIVEVAPYKYRINNPPKMHPAFDFYVVKIAPVSGLSWIKAIGAEVATNSFGGSLKSAFIDMEGRLRNTYGACEHIDILLTGSIWDEPQEWMTGLLKEERLLFSQWDATKGSSLTEALASVFLAANARAADSGYISVEYTLTNDAAAEREIASLHDDAL